MTTNGVTLSHKIQKLREAGLGALNVSLDTLVAAKFQFISRRNGNNYTNHIIYSILYSSLIVSTTNMLNKTISLVSTVVKQGRLAIYVFNQYRNFGGVKFADCLLSVKF